jgi:hypothetical protein
MTTTDGTTAHECPSTAAVAGLAREVEALRRAQQQVATKAEVKRLADLITDLTETTAAAAVGGAEAEPVPSWLTLPGRITDARAVLVDLTGWMRDVYLRYADAERSLPECWLWHPEVVEELVWLMYAWLAAYRDETAAVRAVGDWHDRLRPGVVRRIETYVSACALESHLPNRATGAPTVPVAEAAEAIAAWWADTDRRTAPGPAPTDDQMDAAAAEARRRATGGTR